MGRLAPRFARVEPRRRARAFLLGLLAGLPRTNCWTIAEHAGDASPDGMQHLLAGAVWDAEAVREDLRGYVVEHLGDPEAVLVADETGDVKKDAATVGVQRHYTGTAGRVENAQVAVYLAYASRAGYAFIDRALYLPGSWIGDPARCAAAGVPDDVAFATKPAQARQMLVRALDAGTPARWVAGDEVYGADPGLRTELVRRRVGYVLAVAKDHPISTGIGTRRAEELARRLPNRAWQQLSAGQGAKGERFYDWALVDTVDAAADADHRLPLAAAAPQPAHRRAGVLPRLLPNPGSAGRAGPHRRQPLADRRVIPIQQGTHRPRPAPGPPMGALAPLDDPGDARSRVPLSDDRHPAPTRPRQQTDPLDPQRNPPATDRSGDTRPERPARPPMVELASTTPSPLPSQSLPPPTTATA